MYLKYCPDGDLRKLLYMCKAWNTCLPEDFIWHVFSQLTRGCQIMASDNFNSVGTQEPGPSDGVFLHLDIEPQNRFLIKAEGPSLMAEYPMIRLADFGVAALTSAAGLANLRGLWLLGTGGFFPPEQDHLRIS